MSFLFDGKPSQSIIDTTGRDTFFGANLFRLATDHKQKWGWLMNANPEYQPARGGGGGLRGPFPQRRAGTPQPRARTPPAQPRLGTPQPNQQPVAGMPFQQPRTPPAKPIVADDENRDDEKMDEMPVEDVVETHGEEQTELVKSLLRDLEQEKDRHDDLMSQMRNEYETRQDVLHQQIRDYEQELYRRNEYDENRQRDYEEGYRRQQMEFEE